MLGTNTGCSAYFCSCCFIAASTTGTTSTDHLSHSPTRKWLLSEPSPLFLLFYLLFKKWFSVWHIHLITQMNCLPQIWSIFLSVPLFMFWLSNCILNQHCISHQIWFSYTIIRHFHEISNLNVIYHSLYIYIAHNLLWNSSQLGALRPSAPLDSCGKGTGCQAERITGLRWHCAPCVSNPEI